MGRIIPARAGSTVFAALRDLLGQDHPRSRGVDSVADVDQPYQHGSSPLARGRPAGGWGVLFRPVDHPRSRGVDLVGAAIAISGVRIIPARAGSTPYGAPRSRASRDHPRSRGVDALWGAEKPGLAGSSPLARGRLRAAQANYKYFADHPRSRGVDFYYRTTPHRTLGSSPLARGRRVHVQVQAPLTRIIPARAGSTARSSVAKAWRRDHPRSRGVDPVGLVADVFGGGSSPLARGRPRQPAGPRRDHRIIPARAGSTHSFSSQALARKDHPRSRGVDDAMPEA